MPENKPSLEELLGSAEGKPSLDELIGSTEPKPPTDTAPPRDEREARAIRREATKPIETPKQILGTAERYEDVPSRIGAEAMKAEPVAPGVESSIKMGSLEAKIPGSEETLRSYAEKLTGSQAGNPTALAKALVAGGLKPEGASDPKAVMDAAQAHFLKSTQEMWELRQSWEPDVVKSRMPLNFEEAALWREREMEMDEQAYERMTWAQKAVGAVLGSLGDFEANALNLFSEVLSGSDEDHWRFGIEGMRQMAPRATAALERSIAEDNWLQGINAVGLGASHLAGTIGGTVVAGPAGGATASFLGSEGDLRDRTISAAQMYAFLKIAKLTEPWLNAVSQTSGRLAAYGAEAGIELTTEALAAMATGRDITGADLVFSLGGPAVGAAARGRGLPKRDVMPSVKSRQTAPQPQETPKGLEGRGLTVEERPSDTGIDLRLMKDGKQVGDFTLTDASKAEPYKEGIPENVAPGTPSPWEEGNWLYIDGVQIEEALRGKGAGTDFYREMLRIAGEKGYAGVLGEISWQSDAAKGVWKKLGGKVTEDEGFVYALTQPKKPAKVRRFKEELGVAGATGRPLDAPKISRGVKDQLAIWLGDLKTRVGVAGTPTAKQMAAEARDIETRSATAAGEMSKALDPLRKTLSAGPATKKGQEIAEISKLEQVEPDSPGYRPVWADIIEGNRKPANATEAQAAKEMQDLILSRGEMLEAELTMQMDGAAAKEIRSLQAKAEEARQNGEYGLVEQYDDQIRAIRGNTNDLARALDEYRAAREAGDQVGMADARAEIDAYSGRLWRPFKNVPGVVPLEPTGEMYDILRGGGGDRWDAVTTAFADANNMDVKKVRRIFRKMREDLLGEADVIGGTRAASLGGSLQADFQRSFPRNPYAVQLPGSKKRIYLFEHDPMKYAQRFTARGALQVGFRQKYGQDIRGDGGAWARRLDELQKEGANEAQMRAAVQLGQSLQGTPIERSIFGIEEPGGTTGRIMRGLGSIYNATKTTLSAIPNLAETPGAIIEHAGFRGALKSIGDKRILTKAGRQARRLEVEKLRREATITADVIDMHWDPSRPVESLRRMSNETLRFVSGSRAVGEAQETMMGRRALEWTQEMQRGTRRAPSGGDISRLRALGFDYDTAKKISTGQAAEAQYRDVRQRMVQRSFGANSPKSDLSRAEQNRWHRLLTRFDKVASAYIRKTWRGIGGSLDTMIKAGGDTSLTKRERRMAQAGALGQLFRILSGRTVSGAGQSFLYGLALGGEGGVEEQWERLKDNPAKFAWESMVSATLFGKWAQIQRARDGDFDMSRSIWFLDLAQNVKDAMTNEGRYSDQEGWGTFMKLVSGQMPMLKAAHTLGAVTGISSYDSHQMQTARKAYWNWHRARGTMPDFSSFGSSKTPELSKALRVLRHKARSAKGVETLKPEIRKIFSKYDASPAKIAARIRNAKTLAKLGKEQREDLRDYIGDGNYQRLELEDSIFESLAGMIN